MKLTFWGGTGEVTGANYLLEDGQTKILVDCGLIQSGLFCDKKNFEPFHFDPKEIDALILTHAHIDHSGRIPLLVKRGFQGKIYGTPATLDFAGVLLIDSFGILQKEAKYHKHEPIYQEVDVIKSAGLFQKVEYEIKTPLSDNLSFVLKEAGHILGSAVVEIKNEKSGKKIIFSGDLGNYPNPMLRPPAEIQDVDYAVIESTYGDREHENVQSRKDILEDIIEETMDRGGALLIPAFAMERTQELLYEINELVENNRIPRVPIFIDSPLAIKLTSIYREYEKYYNSSLEEEIKAGDDIFKFPGLIFTETTEESKKINNIAPPKIIIAGSGMSNGGRIVHHERLYLSDPQSAVLIIGYQIPGSLGRRLLNGDKKVKIFNDEIEVRAKIKSISGYSAHADSPRLLEWLRPTREHLKKVFVVQGESPASEALATKIRDELAIEAAVPNFGETFTLD